MSTSTVSITPNPSTAARRRPVERKSTGVDFINNNDAVLATPPAHPATTSDNLSKPIAGDAANNSNYLNQSIRAGTTSNRDPVVQVKKPLSNRAGSSGRKAPKPKWVTVGRILLKNLLLVLAVIGLVQMIRKLAVKNVVVSQDGVEVISAEWEGKFAEIESFVKKTTKMIQVQVDAVDRKLDKEISSVKGEMDAKEEKFNEKLNEARENLERLLGEKSKNLLTKEDLEAFFEEYRKGVSGGGGGGGGGDIDLDEVRAFAREIVEKEIEKHAADGLGRVDYALRSSGSTVVRHSEPHITSGSWVAKKVNLMRVHSNADKMLAPSFGEPGQCFALAGSNGFVTIRLRTAIVPEAVTIEHVAKSVAFDRSSAPKDCRVSGWFQGKDSTAVLAESENMFLLTEFTYDLDRSNAQTFNVMDSVGSRVVDRIRFDFSSNHGSSTHTCIYRLRIHGQEPSSISALAAQS